MAQELAMAQEMARDLEPIQSVALVGEIFESSAVVAEEMGGPTSRPRFLAPRAFEFRAREGGAWVVWPCLPS
jgi:hypothetical protein